MTRHLSNRSILCVLVSSAILLLLGGTGALLSAQESEQENEGRRNLQNSIKDIESYSDMPKVEGVSETYFYEIRAGEQWLGWMKYDHNLYRAVGDLSDRANQIAEHALTGQISFQLIREQLEKRLRDEMFGTQKEQNRAARRQLERNIEQEMDQIMNVLKRLIPRTSFSQKVYRYDDGTIREARYSVTTTEDGGDFSLYLQPIQGQPGNFEMLIPNTPAQTLEVNPNIPVVNAPLAAKMMVEDEYTPEEQPFLFLVGTRNNPLLQGQARVLDEGAETIELHEQEFTCRKVRVRVVLPNDLVEEETWYIDEDGIIRRMVRKRRPAEGASESGGEEGSNEEQRAQGEEQSEETSRSLVVEWAPRENAMRGLEFYFSRDGRRNPFEPTWTQRPEKKEEDEEDQQQKPPECKNYSGEEMLNKARRLLADAKKSNRMENSSKRVNEQSEITSDFSSVKRKVFHCGNREERKKIQEMERKLREQIRISSIILSKVKDQLRLARAAFRNNAFRSISTFRKKVEDWVERLPSNPPEDTVQSIKEVQKQVNELEKRGKIHMNFLRNAPPVRGVVYTRNSRRGTVSVGLNVLGEKIEAEMETTLPETTAVAIVETVEKDKRQDVSRTAGETVKIEELGEVTIHKIRKDGVTFSYRGENIKVPLISLTEGPTGSK